MTVVPSFEKDLVCSNEFEILKPCSDIGAFAICFLLKTSYVVKQIEHLTSGTSSSHSRIKREQLATIKIPYPVSNVAKQKILNIGADHLTSFILLVVPSSSFLPLQLKASNWLVIHPCGQL